MGILLKGFKLREIDLPTVSRLWTQEFRRIKKSLDGQSYFILCHALELTRQMDVIADCGLQKDIRAQIHSNNFSFNRSWTSILDRSKDILRLKFDSDTENEKLLKLAAQLNYLFKKHHIREYSVTIAQCDQHDYVVFVEAHSLIGQKFLCSDYSEEELSTEVVKIYNSLLKNSQMRSASDWEKAVHELASPLDFIYSNSDFISYYLTRKDVDNELKKKKLEDFRLISQLLINRLHQFRFAFAGLPERKLKPQEIDLLNLCMPITHLWYHEAARKGINFEYDGLKYVENVWSDEELLHFVLFNLISNAIKYSYRGAKINLYARVLSDRFVIGVKNKGIVIEEEERLLIFNSGYRSEEARKVDARGMGIGLGVSRALMRRLNGGIALIKSNKKETLFEIEAPLLDHRSRL